MPSCERCERYFNSWFAYNQHLSNSSTHNICDDCQEDFPTLLGLKQHFIQSRDHHYCPRCNLHFDCEEGLKEHVEESHWACLPCRRLFKNEAGLHEHYRQSDDHHYCFPCNRHFKSASNLNSHLNSSVHHPKDVRCPLKCGKGFVSRAAVVLHLESGACPSGVNRALIDKYVRQYDTNNVRRMITEGSVPEDVTYIANGRSWNGSAYECYLCHGEYRTLGALNQHLGSPKHQEKIYVCPGRCGYRCSALSALVQHIESEKCGVMKFKAVRNTMDNLLGRMDRLAIAL